MNYEKYLLQFLSIISMTVFVFTVHTKRTAPEAPSLSFFSINSNICKKSRKFVRCYFNSISLRVMVFPPALSL